MFREVLKRVCTDDLHHEVVAEVDDGRQAVDAVAGSAPDLILLDLNLPGLGGFEILGKVRQIAPKTRFLILSSHCDDFTVFRAERAHVNGFVDKNTNTVAALKAAIEAVDRGNTWFSDTFLRVKAARHRNPRSFDKLLTGRERAVLALIGVPYSDPEVAQRLAISRETVEKHRFNILHKLDLATTSDLVRYAHEHGFTLGARPDGNDLTRP
jgi:DNA-binding NarL/FixJ family response regulator